VIQIRGGTGWDVMRECRTPRVRDVCVCARRGATSSDVPRPCALLFSSAAHAACFVCDYVQERRPIMDWETVPAGTLPPAALTARGADHDLDFAAGDSVETALGASLWIRHVVGGRRRISYSSFAGRLLGMQSSRRTPSAVGVGAAPTRVLSASACAAASPERCQHTNNGFFGPRLTRSDDLYHRRCVARAGLAGAQARRAR
jgi:hypothetical protein